MKTNKETEKKEYLEIENIIYRTILASNITSMGVYILRRTIERCGLLLYQKNSDLIPKRMREFENILEELLNNKESYSQIR
jgi:hypothetical protein